MEQQSGTHVVIDVFWAVKSRCTKLGIAETEPSMAMAMVTNFMLQTSELAAGAGRGKRLVGSSYRRRGFGITDNCARKKTKK